MKHRWKPTQQRDNEREVDTTQPNKKLSELEDEMARLRQQPDVLRYHVLEDAARDLQLSPMEPASIIEKLRELRNELVKALKELRGVQVPTPPDNTAQAAKPSIERSLSIVEDIGAMLGNRGER
jgi:ribosomal protein L29